MTLRNWINTRYRQEERIAEVPEKYPGKTREDYITYLVDCAKFAKRCGLNVEKLDKEKLSFVKSGSRWAFIWFFMGSKKRYIEPDFKQVKNFLLYDLK